MVDFKTRVILVGGLGNQLFGYVLGRWLEEKLGHDVEFDLSELRFGFTNHKLRLSQLALEGKFIGWPSRMKRVALSRLPTRKHQPVYVAKNKGFEGPIFEIQRGTEVRGYFQSYRYFDDMRLPAIKAEQILPRRGPSRWTREKAKLASRIRPVSVHFRRNDYRKLSHTLGLLGVDYYRRAFEELRQLGIAGPVWIFSDEPNLAESFFSTILKNFEIVVPPKELSSSESLFLMTHAKAHVIANSTFSWWGAKLSEFTEAVVAPDPWFKKEPSPSELLPRHWKMISHNWGDGFPIRSSRNRFD